jgi:hypothetical protein
MTLYLYQSFFLWSRNVIPRKNNYVKMPYCQFIQIVPYSWNVHICVKAQRSPLSTNFEPWIYIFTDFTEPNFKLKYTLYYIYFTVYTVYVLGIKLYYLMFIHLIHLSNVETRTIHTYSQWKYYYWSTKCGITFDTLWKGQFFQYCDIAPCKVITLNPLCILFGISSLLLRDSDSCRPFSLLKAIAKRLS